MFGFPFFAIFASRLSSILFTWSLHGLPRLLILAHLESREFLANSIPRRWLAFIFLAPSRRLVDACLFALFSTLFQGHYRSQVSYILVLLFKLMHSPNYIA